MRGKLEQKQNVLGKSCDVLEQLNSPKLHNPLYTVLVAYCEDFS